MNWQKWAAILAVIGPLIGAVWWFASNIVLAEDYNTYQMKHAKQQDVRWLQYDAENLYNKWRELQRFPSPSRPTLERIQDLERQMMQKRDEIAAARR